MTDPTIIVDKVSAVVEAVGLLLLTTILIRQELFRMSVNDQISQISAEADTLIADEASTKAAVAEVIAELKALRDAQQPVDPAQLDSILQKLTTVHGNLSADDADLVASEQPDSVTTPAPASTTDSNQTDPNAGVPSN